MKNKAVQKLLMEDCGESSSWDMTRSGEVDDDYIFAVRAQSNPGTKRVVE